jgi:hypothetical protein
MATILSLAAGKIAALPSKKTLSRIQMDLAKESFNENDFLPLQYVWSRSTQTVVRPV